VTIRERVTRAAVQVGQIVLPGNTPSIAAPVELRTVQAEPTLWIRDPLMAAKTSAGETITVERSLHLDAVAACVLLLGETGGGLPLLTYRRRRGGQAVEGFFGSTAGTYVLLRDEPAPDTTAMDLWSTVIIHLASWGNSYLGKQTLGDQVVALRVMYPERMRVAREGGVKAFYYRPEGGGQEVRYTSDEIIHIAGPSLDGLVGLSPISLAREAIGLGVAMDKAGAGIFGNGALVNGVLETENELSDKAFNRLKADFDARHRGAKKAYRTAILESGVTFKSITMALKDAQFVESQKLNVQKVARVFRVPPELVGGESGGSLTYSTVESAMRSLLILGLQPYLTRIEQAINRDVHLFPRPGRAEFCAFDTRKILRADHLARAQVYQAALNPDTGWMRREEVRDFEGLPPEASPPETEGADRAMARLDAVIASMNNRAPDPSVLITPGGESHV
jgi:HK97 family phage portal protein